MDFGQNGRHDSYLAQVSDEIMNHHLGTESTKLLLKQIRECVRSAGVNHQKVCKELGEEMAFRLANNCVSDYARQNHR
ncbi:hypothetical protein H696_00071 [Fonticula alba]|uniref:Uncharacterized protein n=1 Tax=Fonticula alba TaxID=691883 RepID=A0A058ZDL0_FONAL|nr:hypothetical protein H696_00071 [Fonticula alba]KCV72475.1 hypothetical protein H696_00071 [Fonticula alba]|eukprot:XP_009492176.1 hypothetical protein H696_00071 [Fonticula alba]